MQMNGKELEIMRLEGGQEQEESKLSVWPNMRRSPNGLNSSMHQSMASCDLQASFHVINQK